MQLHRLGTSHPRSDTPSQSGDSLRVAPSEKHGPGVSTFSTQAPNALLAAQIKKTLSRVVQLAFDLLGFFLLDGRNGRIKCVTLAAFCLTQSAAVMSQFVLCGGLAEQRFKPFRHGFLLFFALHVRSLAGHPRGLIHTACWGYIHLLCTDAWRIGVGRFSVDFAPVYGLLRVRC